MKRITQKIWNAMSHEEQLEAGVKIRVTWSDGIVETAYRCLSDFHADRKDARKDGIDCLTYEILADWSPAPIYC